MQGSACPPAPQQHSYDNLAASCDRTHLYIIWGLTPPPPSLTPAANTTLVSEASGSRTEAARSWQRHRRAAERSSAGSQIGPSSTPHTAAGGLNDTAGSAAQNTDHNLTDRDSVLRHGDFRGLTGPDDLVASLRRLRPHLHASEPFGPQSAGSVAPQRASASARRSSLLRDGTNSGAVAQTGVATGSCKECDVNSIVESGVRDRTEQVLNVGECDGKQAMGGSTAGARGQHCMPAVETLQAQQAQQAMPQLADAAHHSALSQAGASSAGDAPTEHEGTEPSCSAYESQPDTACPAWPCLKAAHTKPQLKALYQCCSTVACFDIFEMLSHTADQTQGSQRKDEGPAHGHAEQPQQHQGCRVQPLWSHAVIAAAHLSAGDGVVAVACSDGMLLLLDQASGNLIR